jgi:hypothetical protein
LEETPRRNNKVDDSTPRRPVSAIEPLSIKKKNSIHRSTSPVSELKPNGIVRSHASPYLARTIGNKTPERGSKRKEPPVSLPIEVDISLMTEAERDAVKSFIAMTERSKSSVSRRPMVNYESHLI